MQDGVYLLNFDNDTDINLFRNAQKNDIIRSNSITIKNCKFTFDITPNGWSATTNTVLWLNLMELPNESVGVKTKFKVKLISEGMDFQHEREWTLTTKINGGSSSISLNPMPFQYIINKLNSFSFQCEVQVLECYNAGSQPPISNPQQVTYSLVMLDHIYNILLPYR